MQMDPFSQYPIVSLFKYRSFPLVIFVQLLPSIYSNLRNTYPKNPEVLHNICILANSKVLHYFRSTGTFSSVFLFTIFLLPSFFQGLSVR